MRCIIAGSRQFADNTRLVDKAVVESGFDIDEEVSGCASGIDRAGEYWAQRNGVKITRFAAQWSEYGKSAGYKRNVQMAEYVGKEGGCIVIMPPGGSRGSQMMVDIANHRGLKVYVMEAVLDGVLDGTVEGR